MNEMLQTLRNREDLYHKYSYYRCNNYDFHEIAEKLEIGEIVLKHIIAENEHDVPVPEEYTRKLILELLAEGGSVEIYQNVHGELIYNNELYGASLQDVLYEHNWWYQACAPRLYAQEFREELLQVINEDLKQKGVEEQFQHYVKDWEKATGAKFTPEFFKPAAPQTQMSFFFDPNLIEKGYYNKTEKLLSDFVAGFEELFFEQNESLFANHLFASSSVMDKLQECFYPEDNEQYGMDLINGRIDIDGNINLDKDSGMDNVFALGSNIKGNKDNPLYLVRDESLRNDVIVLKYIP